MPPSQQAKFTGNWTFPYYQKEKSIHFQVLIVTCAINYFYMVVQHVIFSFLFGRLFRTPNFTTENATRSNQLYQVFSGIQT